jgi:hypothetical protein
MKEATYPTAIAAKIAAQNKVNQVMRDQAPAIVSAFKPFIGKKASLTSSQGGCVAPLRRALPPEPPNRLAARLLKVDSYGIQLVFFSDSFEDKNGGLRPHRATAQFYLADLRDNILTAVNDFARPEDYRVDYTEKDVSDARLALAEAEIALRRIQNSDVITLFGKFD